MKNSKLFQYIFIGAFVFFIIVGAILFATYRSNTSSQSVAVNITLWGTLPSESVSSFIAKYFSEAELKYSVNYQEKDLSTFDRDLVEALASGVGPDAVILPNDLIVRFSDKIYTIPYTVLPELIFKQSFIQGGEIYLNKNGVLAIPFSVDPLVMYWNRDIFNNAGVTKAPTNWTEISNLVPKMTKRDQSANILTSTIALGEFRNIKNAKEILSALIIQSGNPIVRYSLSGSFESVLSNNFGYNPSPAASALQFYTNFSNPSKPVYSWNRALANSQDVFANGDLAIYLGFASEYIRIKAKNPNLNFGVAILPQVANAKVYSTYGNMLGLAIMKSSTDPAGTFSVLNALSSSAAFPYWKDILNIPSARRDILGRAETNAIKSIFNQSAIISRGWAEPGGYQTSVIFQNMIESYVTGREDINSVIGTASDLLAKLLK